MLFNTCLLLLTAAPVVQLSASAIPEYTRNSAVLAIYGNQNNYLQVCAARQLTCTAAQAVTHRKQLLHYVHRNLGMQGIGKLYSQLIFYIVFVCASLLALIWGAIVPCFRKVSLRYAAFPSFIPLVSFYYFTKLFVFAFALSPILRSLLPPMGSRRAQDRPSNLDEMMSSVKVPSRR